MKLSSIKTKVILIVALALTTSYGLFTIFMIKSQYKFFMDYMRLNVGIISETILDSLEIHMLKNDRYTIRHTIEKIGKNRMIKELRLINHKGKIVFSKQKNEIGIKLYKNKDIQCSVCHSNISSPEIPKVVYYKDNSNSFQNKAIVPILNNPTCYTASCHAHSKDEKILGFLNLCLCAKPFQESIKQSELHIFLIAIVFIFLFSTIMVLFLKKLITDPLWQLVENTKKISKGDFNIKLPVNKKDEIGELARSFKKMVVRIQEFKEKLEGLNRELEKRVEEKAAKLKLAQKTIIQAEKMSSLGRLAAVIAHEINNPISGLVVFINLLRKQVEKGNLTEKDLEKMNKNLIIMESEAKRCGKIVSELLAFSRSESQILPTDISEILKRSVEIMKLRIRDRDDIVIKLDIEPSLPLIKCDAGKMQQVFMNLIQNAIEAMPMGGEIDIKAFFDRENRQVQIHINDTGVGIPEEYLAHIFEPFYSSKENGQSIGIGLFVVYGVIEQIGGKITVDSEVGKGTSFKIYLPVE